MAIAHDIAVGQELPPLEKDLTQRHIDAYSGVRTRSIHTDEAWARRKGFRTTLAQGMMSTAYVSEMMTRLLGAGFIKGGAMSVAFVKPVYAGDRLTDRGQRSLPRMTSELANQLDAIHVRHGEVGDDRVDPRRRLEVRQRFEAVSRRHHARTAGPEERRQDVERVVGVLGNDQREAGEIRQVDSAHHRDNLTASRLRRLRKKILSQSGAPRRRATVSVCV